MKKLLLLSTLILTLMSVSESVQAQSCPITSAKISSDGECIFVNWDELLRAYAMENVLSIQANGRTYYQNDTATILGSDMRYSELIDSTFLSDCDTAGSEDFFGAITFTLFQEQTCEFEGGSSVPACPDDIQVSKDSNCLLFFYPDGYLSTPPDTVTLNDTVYYSLGYNPANPTTLMYINDSLVEQCDTVDMSSLLNDTLFIGPVACVYKEGLLPIVILAFEYTSLDGRVDLAWKVNSDEPTQRLYLQRSYDGIQWMSVYDQAMNQPGAGVVTTGSYTDASVEQPKVFYRLFVEGFHGKSSYSNVLPVTMKDAVINSVFYQPQSRSIMIKAGQNFTGDMYLFNTHGQNVLEQTVELPRGGFVEVQLKGALPAGIYFVKFENSLIPPTKLFIN